MFKDTIMLTSVAMTFTIFASMTAELLNYTCVNVMTAFRLTFSMTSDRVSFCANALGAMISVAFAGTATEVF